MLVLPTDWSPKNTSLYFASADARAILLIWWNHVNEVVLEYDDPARDLSDFELQIVF